MNIDGQNGKVVIDKNKMFNIDISNKIEDFVGIYIFYNSKYFYVGQSIHVLTRIKEHKSRLSKNRHENIVAQRVYNKYKDSDPFIFKSFLECNPNDLDYFEEFCYINFKENNPDKTPLNIAKCGCAGDPIKSSINKSLSFTGKDHPWKYKKIVQLDKEGNLIKIWDSAKVVKKELGIIIHMEKHTCGGFQWQHYDDWIINPKGKVNHVHNIDDTVKQFDLNGNFITEWESPKKASEGTNTSHSNLIAALSGINKTAGNYLWSYTNIPPKYNNSKPRHNIPKILYQFDTSGNFIKECKSINSVAKEMGVTSYEIKRCISGHIDSIKGFTWKYQK